MLAHMSYFYCVVRKCHMLLFANDEFEEGWEAGTFLIQCTGRHKHSVLDCHNMGTYDLYLC